MTTDSVNDGRRRFLIGATAAVGAVGAGFVAVPFVKSWNPSAKAKAAGAPIKVDVSKIEPGGFVIQEWRGKPVWIVRRTQDMLDNLGKLGAKDLADPESVEEQQPDYASGLLRTREGKEEFLVLLGKCTHLGCSPKYRPEPSVELVHGGFYCPCHGSKFDFSGRVYKGVPAPSNLVVPPHYYINEKVVLVGLDGEAS